MGRSKMTSLKIALLPLAICLLLSHKSEVSGKPSPKYYLIETKAKANKIFDYTDNINNSGGVGVISDKSKNVNGNKQVFSGNKITGSTINVSQDYVDDINNSGIINTIIDGSTNIG